MALGQVIVRQLELADRGSVLDRWLAHHLAEVIAEADRAAGPAKAASESRAVELILKLWAHRRILPEAADPLGGYRKAVEVLGRLMPDANPWARFRRPETSEDLLRETFEVLSRIVIAGVLLTQAPRARSVTAAETKGLEAEEVYLQSVLDQWMSFFPLPRRRSEIKFDFVNADASEGEKLHMEPERLGDSGDQDHTSDEGAAPADDRLHATIVSDLEHMQNRLAELLSRWQRSVHCHPEFKAEDSSDAEPTPPDHTRSFWSSSSLAELAEAQGVAPVENLEAIAALWPSDNDPDELLDYVLAERAARRRAMGSATDR